MGKPQEEEKGYSTHIANLLYKGLKGTARIPTGDLISKNRRCRNQHSMAFQIPSATAAFGNFSR